MLPGQKSTHKNQIWRPRTHDGTQLRCRAGVGRTGWPRWRDGQEGGQTVGDRGTPARRSARAGQAHELALAVFLQDYEASKRQGEHFGFLPDRTAPGQRRLPPM